MRGTFEIPEISDIQKLRKDFGWRPRTKSKWKEIIQKSRFFYSVYDNEKFIGMGRIVEDGVMCMIYDVLVCEEYQKQGVGKMIMNALIDKVKNKKYTCIGLFASKEAIKFYEKLDFEMYYGMALTKYMD